MFLKRISMSGFKSFADRVNLTFGPGITCIVGPNGCGKSNIVDSFKWVLGEQSAKSLRGRQMLDMIFAGSSGRRAAGVAQVDLVFDNADRALPLDFEEITVSRKLYRSGESEYLINRDAVRRKDIHELFMDTGIGTSAYSVIEQGSVERLVQSSSLDRRLIFEEAAGISKYKARRREAQRKLERTRQNLLRVADIIDEVEKRLRSVKLQAGKARNFQQYDQRLRELQSRRALAEYLRLTARIEEQRARAGAVQDEASALSARVARCESDSSERTARRDRLDEEIRAADAECVRTQSARSMQEERVTTALSRIAEQRALLARSVEQHDADTARRDAMRRELGGVEGDLARMETESGTLEERVERTLAEDQAFARDLTRAQATLEDEKAGIVELLRRTAQAHNEIISLRTHRESLLGQKGKLATRAAHIESELQTHLEHQSRLSARLREFESLVDAQQQRLEAKKNEAQRVDRVRSELAEQLAQMKEQRSAMLSRQELLRSLEKKMEGVGKGARSLLEARHSADAPGPLASIRGLVADFFETDVAHAPVIEAALGASDEVLVVDDLAAFLSRPEPFANLPGSVTVVGLDHLPPLVNARDYSDRAGFVAHALDLVRVPEPMSQLAAFLLGKTIVTRTLVDALSLMRDDPYGHRFVTVSGEVVEPDGRVRLGPPSSTAGLISRKSELRDLERRLEETEHHIGSMTDQLNRTQAEVAHILDMQQQLRASIHESQTGAVEARAGLSNVEEAIRRLSTEQPLIAGEVALLERQMDEALSESDKRREALADMERRTSERETRVQGLQDDIDRIVERRRACQECLTQTRVELGQLGEKRRTARERIGALRRDAHELGTRIQRWLDDIRNARARIGESEQAVLDGRRSIERLALAARRVEAGARELRRTREMLRIDLEALGRAVTTARRRLQDAEARLHEVQMALAESQVRRDDLVARTSDELGIDLTAAQDERTREETDWEAVESEIAELRRKITRLGNVNLDAITELEELERRDAFLTGQRDDLSESATQLERLIERLNAESAERFRATFEEVRENFRGMFRKLFGGGRADIILENPDDVLESGIDIIAQPPGKELQSISLMSGGEKSMTAIAITMSIFQSHPSPFAILDEVDAALDEANNERFNQIVREFVSQSQFIVITHSRRTMGMGDRLYGITMQEPGISTLVSVQLEKVGAA